MYQSARRDPSHYFIGADPNLRPLARVSERIYRKPSKGGAPNALFVHAGMETIPSELEAIANKIFILFPWGSLLRAVARPDPFLLTKLKRVCAPHATLDIVFGWDQDKDCSEISRLGLPVLAADELHQILIPHYLKAGFDSVKIHSIPASDLRMFRTSWSKRLSQNHRRHFIHLTASGSA